MSIIQSDRLYRFNLYLICHDDFRNTRLDSEVNYTHRLHDVTTQYDHNPKPQSFGLTAVFKGTLTLIVEGG